MENFNFGALANALLNTENNGVNFSGKAAKWESEKDAQSLVEAIKNCKVLNYLNLEGNTLGVEAAKAIGKALEKHPEFREALWKDLFTGRMKTEIPPALQAMGNGLIVANAKLTKLDCSDNALGPNGMVGLVGLLKSETCYSLEDLRLNNCGLGIGGGKMLSAALLDCHKESVKKGKPFALKTFIAGRNRLENDGATALSQVFAACKSLEHIEMPQNGIYHVGISALSEALRENPNLQILNLNDNTIGYKGAIALSDAFYSVQRLKEINFGDCLLKSKGAMLIATAIQDEHLELETINLSFNEIGPGGGYAIAEAMYNKDNLIQLNLDGNQFGSDCREQIKEMLAECGKLDALGSLDEDDSDGEEPEEGDEEGEEEEEEDENDDGDEDDETEEVDSDEVEEGELIIHQNNGRELDVDISTTLNINKTGNTSINLDETLPNTIEAYCNTQFPTETMFYALAEIDKITGFRNYLKTLPMDDYLVYLVFTILKCSELSEKSKEALELSEALFNDAFEYAKNNNRVKSLRNFFLIQLNLLKCEDSKFKPGYNVQACRYALENAMNKKLVPADEENIFRIFLDQQK
uniref:Putative ran gtpase-activating protein n=1 Tax=Corethrella appendiculata TaxID=1370023 RepID=U5EZK0_9DIPT